MTDSEVYTHWHNIEKHNTTSNDALVFASPEPFQPHMGMLPQGPQFDPTFCNRFFIHFFAKPRTEPFLHVAPT